MKAAREETAARRLFSFYADGTFCALRRFCSASLRRCARCVWARARRGAVGVDVNCRAARPAGRGPRLWRGMVGFEIERFLAAFFACFAAGRYAAALWWVRVRIAALPVGRAGAAPLARHGGIWNRTFRPRFAACFAAAGGDASLAAFGSVRGGALQRLVAEFSCPHGGGATALWSIM